jgi:2-polyprenyl-3-methyl-5-hydroxy-6-metoxy-1,4-benzoquinol methylase
MNDPTYDRRKSVAQQTRGISNDAIYAAVFAAMKRAGCRGDLLDFGAGAGACLRELKQAGRFKSLTGVDIMTRPGELPSEVRWEMGDLNNTTPFADASFDVVLSSEVIEHLENPRAIFREWWRLLRPGGWVICSTPNNESVRSIVAILARGHFAGFGEASYPAHITALLRKDFERICRETGFRLKEFSCTNSGGLPGRPGITWQTISGGLCRGIRFCDNIIMTAQKDS